MTKKARLVPANTNNVETIENVEIHTNEQFYKWANDEDIPNDENPAFLFSNTYTKLLSMIAKGEIDPVWLAKKALAGRGLDKNGLWIGFNAAEIENFK